MLKYCHNRRKKGQSTLEYAVLTIIILGALMSVQVYIKRGIQGRFKSSTDDIGDQFSVGNQNSITNKYSYSKTRDTFDDGVTRSELTDVEQSIDTVSSNIISVESEKWNND